jgi:predicted oxidoreductase
VRDGVAPQDLTHDDVARVARLINVAHASGVTMFDTASVYGGGSSEAALGRALALSPGLREQLVIQTKFMGLAGVPVIESVEQSLKRLRTDHLDILLLHTQDPLMEPEELAADFDELERSGKVRYFGVSNHSIPRIELLKRHLRQPLVVNQFQVGLAHPDLLDEVTFDVVGGTFRLAGPFLSIAGVDYSRLHGMQVQAYSPLRGGNVFGTADLLGPPSEAPPQMRKLAETLHRVAAAKGVSAAAIGLAWLMQHPARIVPIIGSKQEKHIVECCAADEVLLSADEWRTLWWSALDAASS